MRNPEPALANRRQILLGLAAASTAAASGSPAQSAASETTELLRLADELPALLARYVSARDHAKRIFRETHAKWPRAPEEICGHHMGQIERDVVGAGITWPDQKKVQHVETPAALKNDANCRAADIARLSKFKRIPTRRIEWNDQKRVEALGLVPIAERYWRKVEKLKAASGYEDAARQRGCVENELKAHVSDIMNPPKKSMTGVVIKAQALKAWEEVDLFTRAFNYDGLGWANEIASAILRRGTIV